MSLFGKKVVIEPPKSVASITAGLSDTLAELESHAQDQAAMAVYQKEMAELALLVAAKHTDESELALKVAGNIKALLGGED